MGSPWRFVGSKTGTKIQVAVSVVNVDREQVESLVPLFFQRLRQTFQKEKCFAAAPVIG
jgi:hypothetical protein